MFVIGLTGGIASGKSTAASYLRELGAEVIDADLLGHRIYEPGTRGFENVVRAFGDDIVAEDGTIDRRRPRRQGIRKTRRAAAVDGHRVAPDPRAGGTRDRADRRFRSRPGHRPGGGRAARGPVGRSRRRGLGRRGRSKRGDRAARRAPTGCPERMPWRAYARSSPTASAWSAQTGQSRTPRRRTSSEMC